jgi:hypothetical protein
VSRSRYIAPKGRRIARPGDAGAAIILWVDGNSTSAYRGWRRGKCAVAPRCPRMAVRGSMCCRASSLRLRSRPAITTPRVSRCPPPASCAKWCCRPFFEAFGLANARKIADRAAIAAGGIGDKMNITRRTQAPLCLDAAPLTRHPQRRRPPTRLIRNSSTTAPIVALTIAATSPEPR